jgi:AcrR family transcriptional regulator
VGKQLRIKETTVKPSSTSPFKNRAQKALDHEEKRLAVLRAAAELFVTRGFHRTKLTDLAERLSITKPAIYYYFGSKDEILIECTHMALEATRRYFQESDDVSLDGRKRLEKFMRWFGVSMTEPFGKCLVRVAEHDMEQGTQEELVAAKREIYRRLRQLVECGIQDGSITNCDAKAAAFTIAGALGWLSHWYRPEEKWSTEEASERVTALLLHGLSATPREST